MKAALLGLVVLAGCADDLVNGSVVDRPRLLGARVEAKADPRRASLVAGEAAHVRWLVASRGPKTPVSIAWALCATPDGNFAMPRCTSAPVATGIASSDAFDFVAPALAPDAQMLVAVCTSGAATLDPARFEGTCVGEAPLLGATSVKLEGVNLNPEIAADDVLLDGAVVPPTELGEPGAPCTPTPEMPLLVTGAGDRPFAFRFRNDAREEGETLIVTHTVTFGELDRQFSAIDPHEAAPKVAEVKWEPAAASEAGVVVESFFVLRDGRGGTAFSRRALCARPR